MHTSYEDIRKLTTLPPKWFDEHAVPRYCEFHPWHCADIYARQAALVEVRCQGCGKHYMVALTWGPFNNSKVALERRLRCRDIHYGDPPNACGTDKCFAGATMTSETIRCEQFWKKSDHQWLMIPELSNLVLADQPAAPSLN